MPDPQGGSLRSLRGEARQLQTTGGVYGGSFYGAGLPIPPVLDGQAVRQWDFPPGVNMVQTPRHTEPFNFRHLRAFANVELIRMAIETRKDQLERLDWMVKPREEKLARKAERDPRCLEVEKFLAKPDGQTLFQPFFRALEEDLLAIDAPCLERKRTRGGKLYGLELVDGSTINLLVDNTGRRPRGDEDIAFQQVIRGMVWANLTNRDILYAPRNIRTGHIYGFSPVEQIIVTINTIIRRQASQLSYFTEGNVPQGIISAPEGWTNEQIRELQEWFDQRISGNQGQQRSVIWTPHDSKYAAFKDSPIKDEFDEWLARLVAFAFSLPPTPFIRQMNKGTAGADQERSLEEGLEPLKLWRKRLLDNLIADEFGYPDLEFVFKIEREIDPKMQADIDDIALKNGSAVIDEVRDARGQEPYPDGTGAKARIYGGNALTIEQSDAAGELKANPPPPPTPVIAAPGAVPPKPGKVPPKAGAPASDAPPNKKKLSKYSDDQPRDEHGRFEGGGGGNTAFARGLVDAHGVATQRGMETLASNWIAGSWEPYQIAAESVIRGESKEDFAREHGDDAAGTTHDFAAGVMDKINGSEPLDYPLYRGLVGVNYKVGDTFSESLTTWTSKEELAKDFAHDRYNTAGTNTWGNDGEQSGAVFKVTGNGMHGINITDINPDAEFENDFVNAAAEHITSGQYRVTSVASAGHTNTYTVERIGNAQASDLKKVVPVEFVKYSDDQPRDERGRWEGGGGSGTFATDLTTAELPATMEQMASEPDVHQNIINMTVDGKAIFNPDASLGIARGDMPQIPDDQRAAFLSNYESQIVSVDPSTLGPTQNELDSFKVGLSATGRINASDPPLVSSDHYIIDGHHHWAGSVARAQTDSSERITVHQINETRANLMIAALSYDSAHGISGAGIADKMRKWVEGLLHKYSEDQPRDERGRWEGGGGSSSGSSSSSGGSGNNASTTNTEHHDFPIQQLSDEQLKEMFGILAAGEKWHLPTGDEQNLAEWDETLDHAEWEAPGDFRPDQSAFATSKYSDDQPRDERGRWEGGGGGGANVLFEVGPNPDNQELSARWNSLSDSAKATISAKVSAEFTPRVLAAAGLQGSVEPALGGFEGEVNPSLVLTSGNPFEAAGVLGDTFGQKAMVVMSDKPMDGLSPVGMVSVEAAGADASALRDMQGKIGDLADGFTYRDGRMEVLNFSGTSDEEFATEIDNRLGNAYVVEHATVYSAYIEANDYVRPESDSHGNPWQQTAGSLRAAFSQRLEESLQQVGDEAQQIDHPAKLLKKKEQLSKAPKLPPKSVLLLSIDNPIVAKIEATLKGRLLTAFSRAKKIISDRVDAALAHGDDAQQNLAEAMHLIDVIDLSEIFNIHELLLEGLEEAAIGVVPRALASVGVDDAAQLVDQVSEMAVAYARERAAELVRLTGPDSLIETTRQELRDLIANGLENNVGKDQIVADIQESMAFSEYRADLIAKTEIAFANSAGKKLSWDQVKADGQTLLKQWFASGEEGVCIECQLNEDEGEIGYDDPFSSGDEMEPAHPACRCVTTVRVVGEASGSLDTGEEE